MAAETLHARSTYNLITEPENNENRQVYFVKLTDSCLTAIEEFVQGLKTGSRAKSIIRFDEQQNGVMTIPGRNSSANADAEKKFQLTISNHQNTEHVPECIKQSWNSDQLLSFGPIEQKISIAATDDSYVNTGKRMALVEQERKDIRTKEVKLVGKGKMNNIHRKNIVTTDPHKSSLNKSSANKKITPSVPLTKNTTHSPKPSVSSTSHHASSNLSKRSPVPPPTNARKTSPSSTNNTTHPSPGALNGRTFTCKERVIHVLGLRSHKESELISRLQREAMSQKDRNNLKMVLRQVTSYSDNQYTLNPKYYSEINVDTWPFYSESEKATVRKNIAANIIKKTDATSPPVVSSTTSKSPPEEKSLKRMPAPDVVHDRHMSSNKKQKLEVSEEPSSTSVSPPKNSSTTHHNNHHNNHHNHHNQKNERTHPKEERKKPNHISAAAAAPAPAPTSNGIRKTKEPTRGGEKQNNEAVPAAAAAAVGDESPPTVASTSDSPEYLSTYKPITTREQRLQYKRDFQLEYPEYLELKRQLDAVTRKFMELDKSLKQCEEGSERYLEIQEEIMNAYYKQLKDEKYHMNKSRCEELHQKLGHIKRLVCEYDQQMVNS
jgi:RNA polymerase II elongation factor ELL